tara:strand:+ start:399 stop:941 length:543 start_codon:yes stop_codon:yes gene_type:complete
MTEELANKQVFTTGEAAKICNVSQQTIIRCFDSGRLQGFKVPGSRFRRIPRAELVRFMHLNGIDASNMESGPSHILVIGIPINVIDSIVRSKATGHNIQIHHVTSPYEAGFLTHKLSPGLILCSNEIYATTQESVSKLCESSEHPIVVKIDNYNNSLNMGSNSSDSNQAIKEAVEQLLTA